MSDEIDRKYADADAKRQEHIRAILESGARNKIVVAGPGTGKTFLFKSVLNGKSKCLTLTFVNSLVEDLSLELCGLSKVKTLHSFARGILGEGGAEVKVYPKLSYVIQDDARRLLGEAIDFDKLFHERDDGNKLLDFFARRKVYYEGFYGYTDIIFDAARYLERDKSKTPQYEQVVVDEFQDFNVLEVSLIDLLSEKSPVLLAGDDDQALYGFKSASAEHIRRRFKAGKPGLESFSLPHCSRCTRVVIEATNDLIDAAMKNGYLEGRIQKSFDYFDDRKKDHESATYPKIGYKQLYAAQIPWFVETQIGKIAVEVRARFPVLIISPTKTQCRGIVEALRNKGFKNVEFVDRRDEKDPSLLDGFKLLLENEKSNLGWRIVASCILGEDEFEALLKETGRASPTSFRDLLPAEIVTQVRRSLTCLRAVRDDGKIDEEDLISILEKTGFAPNQIARDTLRDALATTAKGGGNPAIRNIPIKVTTIQSSKGLASDFVFIANFDDQYLVSGGGAKLCDQDICNFLVALTRARKKVTLISSRKQEPTFLKWIKKDRIEWV